MAEINQPQMEPQSISSSPVNRAQSISSSPVNRAQSISSYSQSIDDGMFEKRTPDEYRYYMQIYMIHHEASARVLHHVFLKGSLNRPRDVGLLDYYKAHRKKPDFNPEQKKKINDDPFGYSFDITLYFKCLREGYHGLADKNDNKWCGQDTNNMESMETLIYKLKKMRNEISHDAIKYTEKDLREEVNKIKSICEKILDISRQSDSWPPKVDNETNILYDSSNEKEQLEKIINLNQSDVNSIIDKYSQEDFLLQTDRLKALVHLANEKGKEEILEYYRKNKENELEAGNHLIDIKVSLSEVLTDNIMKMRKESLSKFEDIPYNSLLLDEDGTENLTSSIIVLNGVAGAGKTTVTKSILNDWQNSKDSIKHLGDFSHFFRYECRNTAIKNFDELLNSFMPNTAKLCESGEFRKVILNQKILITLDGYDERNGNSASLFKELMTLKKFHDISIIITTRPEGMICLKDVLKCQNIQYKHIELLGVPKSMREELVKKYYNEICKQQSDPQNLSGLLNYLKSTGDKLSEIWKLPYNLTLITVLWANNHMNLRKIHTEPELYKEMYGLYQSKLKERLRDNPKTDCLPEPEMNKKIEHFLYKLAEEAFSGLMEDCINLPEKSYKKLELLCTDTLNVPPGHMLSAFLKPISGKTITYGFPHKGLQDYLSAYYIKKKILEKYNPDQVKKISKEKKPSKFFGFFSKSSTSKSNESIIDSIIKETHNSSEYDVSKLQNVIICLIGMFYSEEENPSVDRTVQQEMMEILIKTGVKDSDDWIKILNSVKCNEFVASFINNEAKLLERRITITDFSVSAYICLMEGLKEPYGSTRDVTIDLEIEENLDKDKQLLKRICFHQFKIRKMLITQNNISNYNAMVKKLRPNYFNDGISIIMTKDVINGKKLIKTLSKKKYRITKLKRTITDLDLNDMHHMLDFLQDCKISVTMELEKDFRNPKDFSSESMSTHVSAMDSILNKCDVKKYAGQMFAKMPVGCLQKAQRVHLSFNTGEDFKKFIDMTNHLELNNLKNLAVHITRNVGLDDLSPLPYVQNEDPTLYLTDVGLKDEAIETIVEVIWTLQPNRESKSFYMILFPRCRLKLDAVFEMLRQLKRRKVEVCRFIVFPTNSSDPSVSLPEIQNQLEEETGYRVEWGKHVDLLTGREVDMDSW